MPVINCDTVLIEDMKMTIERLKKQIKLKDRLIKDLNDNYQETLEQKDTTINKLIKYTKSLETRLLVMSTATPNFNKNSAIR